MAPGQKFRGSLREPDGLFLSRPRGHPVPYAATVFLSSFLLFLVQPLLARLILPWFGGSAAVWTTCMLCFQVLLLAGYAYAHLLLRLAPRRTAQALVHTALLAAAVWTLPILPRASWQPVGGEEPIHRILLVVGATVGLPYFLLAATSPLIQAWYARARPGGNPYRLFALSNLASLGALIGYPLWVEPTFTAHEQVRLWSATFGGFAALCAIVAWRTPETAVAEAGRAATARSEAGGSGDSGDRETAAAGWPLWLALSATGSALLLAVTNHLTQNVAAVPLLWLAPLTVYLATFILAFEGGGWYRPRWMWPLVVVAIGAMAWLLADSRFELTLPLHLGVYLGGLFVGCLFCHGELYRLRPEPARLTSFYLALSAGGALGGLFVAVLSPLVFNAYYELGLSLLALALLAARRFAGRGRIARYVTLIALLGVAGAAARAGVVYQRNVRVSTRSFYGVLRIQEYGEPGKEDHIRRLVHGAILHGEQYQTGVRRRWITTYYQPTSGVGAAIRAKERAGPLRLGVIGLGAGTLAAYGRAGDRYRFYDINPQVVELARREFSFLRDSAAQVEIVLGDARLSLEREPPQGFDVLAIDAFTSDAIPIHLITREALALYLRHVKPAGIVAFHVSNRYLNLIPVVARIAREEGARAVLVTDDPGEDDDEDDDAPRRSRTDWVLVSRDRSALEAPEIREADGKDAKDRPTWRTWTDDYSNLVQILK
jgi:SAM-dependent methyltransferase